MTKVSHPDADNDASPAAVTVGVTTYTVDGDGIVDCPAGDADEIARRLADVHDCDADDLLVADTCDAVKTDGDVCGRELPCPYHTEADA